MVQKSFQQKKKMCKKIWLCNPSMVKQWDGCNGLSICRYYCFLYAYTKTLEQYMHGHTCMVIHGFIFLTLMSWQSHLLHNSLMEMRYHLPHPFSSYISCQTCCRWRSTKADSKVQEANQKF